MRPFPQGFLPCKTLLHPYIFSENPLHVVSQTSDLVEKIGKQVCPYLPEADGSRLLEINGRESTGKTGTTLAKEDILKEVIFEFCEPRRKW